MASFVPPHARSLACTALVSPVGQAIRTIISKWKEWTAKQFDADWQEDFFEHRLRRDESRRQKADYILANPVRAGLVTRPEDWPWVYFGGGERPMFPD